MLEVKRAPKRLIKAEVEGGNSEPRILALSSSDLAVIRVHVQLLFAFEAPAPSSQQLEEGLAKTLVEYKEWAGRLSKDVDGRPAIALNGQGSGWIDAEASVSLHSLMPFNPASELLDLVPPCRGADELLLVQVTKFCCGGIALGIARHHQVADGEAASKFMLAWASAVKGSMLPASSIHDRSVLRARNPPRPMFAHMEYEKPTQKSASQPPVEYPPLSIKKIHFSAEKLKNLKSEAVKDFKGQDYFTTFESLTGHLWRSISRARGLSGEIRSKAMFPVNGRKKLKPPIEDNYFGNVIFHTYCQGTVKELIEQPLSYAVDLVQKAIKKLDDAYMRSALDFVELKQKNFSPIERSLPPVMSPNLGITSWVQLSLYNLDFGSGTPVFAGPVWLPAEGMIIMVPSYTKDGGIDVVLGLLTPDMAKLESFVHEI